MAVTAAPPRSPSAPSAPAGASGEAFRRARRAALPAMADAWFAERAGHAAIARRQRDRLAAMVSYARRFSPFYAELYRHLPDGVSDATLLPIAHKADLMADIERWVTDRTVRSADIAAFLDDPDTIGDWFAGRYLLWSTSGTTGEPAIVLQDVRGLALMRACSIVRGVARWFTPGMWMRLLRSGLREAIVVATDGHYGGVSAVRTAQQSVPWLAERVRAFSVQEPRPRLVAGLEAFRPSLLGGYPSALRVLAEERFEGRLDVEPLLIVTAGETLSPEVRTMITDAFGCPVRDTYAATECSPIALECAHGSLHVQSDWVVLEPIDEAGRPVPDGTPSHSVLVSNLANRIAPILRYDLGDSVTLWPTPCSCGSPLPTIRVEGRASDVVRVGGDAGGPVRLPSSGLGAVLEARDEVRRAQLLQREPSSFELRFEGVTERPDTEVAAEIIRDLHAYLRSQGAGAIAVRYVADAPELTGSGKFRQVVPYRAATGTST